MVSAILNNVASTLQTCQEHFDELTPAEIGRFVDSSEEVLAAIRPNCPRLHLLELRCQSLRRRLELNAPKDATGVGGLNSDVVLHSFEYLDGPSLCRVAEVCRELNQLSKASHIWEEVSRREGVPCVNGRRWDRKRDFMVLCPMTLSGRRIGSALGQAIGPLPKIQRLYFDILHLPDPFDPAHLIRDNYVFVILPTHIKVTSCQERPFILDEQGNLVLTSQSVEECELLVPCSLKNLRVLCAIPLKGGDYRPVFTLVSWAEVFNQCGAPPDRTRVYLMRKRVADQTRKQAYDAQEVLVHREGFEVTPLLVRSLYDALVILESGTCPDGRNPWTRAIAPDIVRDQDESEYHAAIGGFAPGIGVGVEGRHFAISDRVGVAPCVPADLQ